MKRLQVIAIALFAAGAFMVVNGRTGGRQAPPPAAADATWSNLDPQGRCDDAGTLVTHSDRWPTVCTWRPEGSPLQGVAFPPPVGPPPWDRPRIEIFVAPTQTREELASSIAHELGHMHHTRDPARVAEWLEVRGLPAATTSEVWTEDYAEVFAHVYGPPVERWRAPTPRPSAAALAEMKARFLS